MREDGMATQERKFQPVVVMLAGIKRSMLACAKGEVLRL